MMVDEVKLLFFFFFHFTGASLRNSYELAACGVEATKTMSSLAGTVHIVHLSSYCIRS